MKYSSEKSNITLDNIKACLKEKNLSDDLFVLRIVANIINNYSHFSFKLAYHFVKNYKSTSRPSSDLFDQPSS